MYVDNNLIVSGGYSAANVQFSQVPISTGTTLSTNVIDLGTARDMGEGAADIFMRVQVGNAAATVFLGGTSVEIQAIASSDAAQSANIIVLGSTGAIPMASLTVAALALSSRFSVNLSPLPGLKGQRYLSARIIVLGTNTQLGQVFIDFGIEIQDGQKFYPAGSAIL